MEIKRWFTRVLFLPTMLYQLGTRVFKGRRLWDQVDETLLVGAMPLSHDVPRLLQQGVRGIINNCAEYDGPQKSYARHEIQQLHLPIIDFLSPSMEDVERALEFIQRFQQRQQRVFLHCKAGRGRSATIALCYLIQRYQMTPEEAQEHLQAVRPRVIRGLWKRDVVQTYYQRYRPS